MVVREPLSSQAAPPEIALFANSSAIACLDIDLREHTRSIAVLSLDHVHSLTDGKARQICIDALRMQRDRDRERSRLKSCCL